MLARITSKLLVLILLVLFILPLPISNAKAVHLQSGTHSEVTWSKIYKGPGIGRSIVQTSDRGYITGSGWIVKLDSLGNIQWQRDYEASDCISHVASIRQTSDGGFVLAGQICVPTPGGLIGAWVLRLDSHGNILWQKAYGSPNAGSSLAGALSAQETQDGGYIVIGGMDFDFKNGPAGGWIFKLNSAGNMIWQKVYPDTSFHAIVQTLGGYVVAGLAVTTFGSHVAIFKLDVQGNNEWENTYGTRNLGLDDLNDVKQTSDGGYIAAGITMSVGLGSDSWVLKLDSEGNIQWQKAFYSRLPDIDEANSVVVTRDGGYAIGGFYDFGAAGMLIKLDKNGNMLWHRAIGAPASGTIYSMTNTLDNGYIVSGTNSSIPSGGSQLWVAKLDSMGLCCSAIMNIGNPLFDVNVVNTNATVVKIDIMSTVTNAKVVVTQAITNPTSAIVTILCNTSHLNGGENNNDNDEHQFELRDESQNDEQRRNREASTRLQYD